VGRDAGHNNQGSSAIAVGYAAASNNQGTNAVAVGVIAGYTAQGTEAIAVGYAAGQTSQGNSAVAVGRETGQTNQGTEATAVGYAAGNSNQGSAAVAVGVYAGQKSQGDYAIAAGQRAGSNNQGVAAIAMGLNTAYASQGDYAIAVGRNAGYENQGANSVAVGNEAGQDNQHDNSIVLNATGAALNTDQASSFYVKPVRSGDIASSVLAYTPSGEIVEQLNVHFDTNGRLGLGTTAPLNALDVYSDAYATFGKSSYSAAGYSGIRLGRPYTTAHDAYCSVIRSYTNPAVNYKSSLELLTSTGNNATASAFMGCDGVWLGTYKVHYHSYNLSWSGQQGWDVNVTLQAPNAVYYGARCRFWATYSSRKLKENFEPVLDSLDKVKKLNGVYYTWKNGQGDNVPPPEDYDMTDQVKQQKYIGFIADEIAEVLPWVCTFDENGEANGLDYGAITPVLANAIKELDDKIGKSEATSDDRLKDNEEYLRNATNTLMKLKPQLYDKKESFTSNIYHHEAGLIAQDIWYDAPELRFAVKPGLLSEIPLDAPIRSDDPREDPDYSKWGPNPASVDYNYLVPYTIKSIQEIVTELPRQKTNVIGITPSNINENRGLVVISDTNDFKNEVPKLSLSKTSYDKRYFGVISHSNTYSVDNEVLIDTTGTGYIWVINSSNIESGDYLTTSNISGYAMKQNDDLLHNYTICKSTIDCDFKSQNKTVKRIKQELSNVTYYINTKLYEITKEQYDSMDERYKTSREHSYYIKEDYTQVTEKGGYDKMEYCKVTENLPRDGGPFVLQKEKEIISIEEWNSLESNIQNEYSPYYSNLSSTTVSLEDYTTLDEAEKAKCTFTTKTIYSYKVQEESKNPIDGYEPEIRQEYVNVLDENGQIQWEDTEKTEALYKIRYLDANGSITDESNAVHIAALIGCKYC